MTKLHTKKSPVVMYESPEAASVQTVTGWVASDGRFWGADEHMARWCGSTHRQCEKNPDHPAYETRGYCLACREETCAAKFASFETKEWDMSSPVCLFDSDTYFFDADSLIDWLDDNDVKPEDVQLVWCDPHNLSRVDEDYWCDDLPEDHELSPAMQNAIEALNKVIASEPTSCWFPGKVRATLPADFMAETTGASQ